MNSKTNIFLENEATRLRDEMGTRSIDPISIHQILKYKHILGYFTRLGDGFSGMAVKVISKEGERPYYFMLVNTSDFYCRQRFTAAHELYHLLIQKDFHYSYDENIWSNKDAEEINANYFATYLLLPETGIRQLIPLEEQRKNKVTTATLLKLEHNYRCSRMSLLYRLKHLGLVTEEYIDANKNGAIRQAMEYGYDTSLYQPTDKVELVGDYNVKARKLYDEGRISQAKYFSYLMDMGINLKELKNAEKGNID